jgi:hypothetical protein
MNGMQDRQIVERGTHDTLLARGGRYADLYAIQFAAEPCPEARPDPQPELIERSS